MTTEGQANGQQNATEAARGLPGRLTRIIALVMGFILISSTLHLSQQVGRLSRPPGYDDVVYMVEGSRLFETFLQRGPIGEFVALFGQHAPLQSFLAMIGYWIFGVSAWSVYAINGALVAGLVLLISWMGRQLWPLLRLSLVVAALCTPIAMNLVAEFRPDLYWGLLCGVAVYLLLDPSFLTAGFRYHLVAAMVSALALLAKPSAVPATGSLLGVAALAAVLLRRLEVGRVFTSQWERRALLLFVSAIVVVAGPFFAINARDLYNYIYLALVAYRDVNQQVGSFWFHLGYYSLGAVYNVGLSWLFWVGILVILVNALRFWLEGNRHGGLRYAGYAAVVLVAYAIPSATVVKGYYLGGIFYGTFLIFTIHGLALVFADLQRRARAGLAFSAAVPHASALALIAVSVLSISGQSLYGRYDPSQSADYWKVNDYIVEALLKNASARGGAQLTAVYVPAPVPVNADYLTLVGLWRNLNILGLNGYYVRTAPEHEKILDNVDFVVLSEDAGGQYPGAILSPQLLDIVKARRDFRSIITYIHPDRRKTYFFRRQPLPH